MKFAAVATVALAFALTGAAEARSYPEPVPGSITYGGQPRTKLRKAPVGSSFTHDFRDKFGRRAIETYVVQPDRSLLLVRRIYLDINY
ncbi:hypothetical protein LXM94_14190 [Rhizobium sp. TRM95111]|uniref:hypothetical protein n=1 Tax=Rhizobium alarense TaxID=2846851 RepID=UPI001F260DFE|nr:hypothetical protein [Rhizobium alarense]MCF3641122.1 hypothetical protein [Rhizobium alarense]